MKCRATSIFRKKARYSSCPDNDIKNSKSTEEVRQRHESDCRKDSSCSEVHTTENCRKDSGHNSYGSSKSRVGRRVLLGVYDISRLLVSRVYNKLKPEDPDKVVDIESHEEHAAYEFSTKQIKEFRKVFNAFDRDGNDSIGCDELGPVLSALGYSPSPNDIEKVLSRFDADHSGDLSFEEYLALMAVWVEEDETQIIEAFKVFDKSGDGYVTISELKRALCRFGEKFTEEEAEEFFDLIDANNDGIINYEEFVKYMLSEINRGPTPRQVTT